jgi:hypothetical protein
MYEPTRRKYSVSVYYFVVYSAVIAPSVYIVFLLKKLAAYPKKHGEFCYHQHFISP